MNEKLANIAITGQGLISSMGTDASVAAAAYIAGIARRSEDEGYLVFDEDEGDFLPIVSHKAPVLSHGFTGRGRLSLLGIEAFKSLFQNIEKKSLDLDKTGVFVSFPYAIKLKKIYEHKSQLKDVEDFFASFNHQAYLLASEEIIEYKKAVVNILNLVDCRISIENIHIVGGGCASIANGIKMASKCLASKIYNSCLVCAFDSFVDIDLISLLNEDKRIKHGGNPVGFQVGEAGGVLLLETATNAASQGRNVNAIISSVSVNQESSHYFSNAPSSSNAMASAILDVLPHTTNGKIPRLFVSDHNGETFKARELANTFVKLKANSINLDEVKLVAPVESFGETGSANAILSICIAIRMIQKNYHNTNSAVVLSSSHLDERSAISLVGTH